MVKKSLLAKLTPGERKKIKIERLIHRGVLSLFGAIVLPVCIGWFTQEKIVPRYNKKLLYSTPVTKKEAQNVVNYWTAKDGIKESVIVRSGDPLKSSCARKINGNYYIDLSSFQSKLGVVLHEYAHIKYDRENLSSGGTMFNYLFRDPFIELRATYYAKKTLRNEYDSLGKVK
ncbi:hypothetical protein HOD29_05985 [archaeon]|jgi:hypothetical protein|nr:hypothetical protein [archaeon]